MMGNLVVKLGLNSRNFTRGLDQSQARLQKFSFGVKNIALKVAAAVAAVAGSAGIGLGAKLVAEAEQAEVAFTTMLGSARKARKMLDDLKNFAASTPFQLGDLRDAARQLLAFGFAGDEIMGHMKTLGDIAAGTQKPIADFVDIVGKVKATGIASLGDVNRLADRGVPIYQELAKVMGVAAEEVKTLVSTGKVGLPEIQKSLENVVSSGGLFENSMEKQSKTMSGLWSTLKDNILFIIKDLAQAFSDGFDVKGLLTDAIEGVQSLGRGIKAISPFLVQMAKVWGAIFRNIIRTIGNIYSGFKAVFEFIESKTGIFKTMRDLITSMMVILQFMHDNWEKLIKASLNPGGKLGRDLIAELDAKIRTAINSYAQKAEENFIDDGSGKMQKNGVADAVKGVQSEMKETPGAALRGSSEAASAILRNVIGTGDNIQQKLLKQAEKQAKNSEEQKKALKDVVRLLKGQKAGPQIKGASI